MNKIEELDLIIEQQEENIENALLLLEALD